MAEPQEIARENWRRYEYCRMRGHQEYCIQAKKCEDFYLGGGLQWAPEVREQLGDRLAAEVNEIMGAVNTAVGYQIANRMDIQFVPNSDGASDQTAKALDIVVKQIVDNTKFKWHETQVWSDGLIQQRGYFDVRMSFDKNVMGDIWIGTLDPMDVIPDPDAKSYDPDDWLDVIVTRWMTYDEISSMYGDIVAQQAKQNVNRPESDFGDMDIDGIPRSRFGDELTAATPFDSAVQDGSAIRYRVVDRQYHVYDMANVFVYAVGDLRPADGLAPEEFEKIKAQGIPISRRKIRRVRWTVSASCDVLLFDDWSPFEHFTIVPFFPYFRRGRTRGMVDNAISPQEMENKALSQAVHIINSNAHSGWMTEKDSLSNMETEDLEDLGAQNGLNIEYHKGSTPPKKIEPSPIPAGMQSLVTLAKGNIKATMGVNESMAPEGSRDISGVSYQSQQFAAQQKLALPLDNLSRTRNMMAVRILDYIQDFMSDARVIRITKLDAFGKPQTQQLAVNQPQQDGSISNDLTLGEYDAVISDQPMQITFDNSQFEQIKDIEKLLAEQGKHVPPQFILRYSNLADKGEIADAINQQTSTPDPLVTAKTATENAKTAVTQAQQRLINAQADLAETTSVENSVTGMYSATQAAAEIAAMPALAPLADKLLRSAGFADKDAPPIIPQPSQATPMMPPTSPTPGPDTAAAAAAPPAALPAGVPPVHHNTHPLYPPHPLAPPHADVGVNAGIEKPEITQ